MSQNWFVRLTKSYLPNFAGLKSHAVTLSCKDLSTLEGATYEGEIQEFANHLFSLRCVLECLQSGGIVTNIKEEGSSDKLSMITSSNDGQSSEIAESSLVDKSGDCSVLETNK